MERIKRPFRRDSYGTRIKAHHLTHKPENIYKRRSISLLATAVFTATDFTCLYTMWRDSMAATNAILVMLTCIAMAVLLDIPLAIAAHSIRGYEQGLVERKDAKKVVGLSIASFLVVFIPNVVYRFVTIETVMMEDLDENVLLSAAIFLGALPLGTSFGSFVITYFSSNPLADMIFTKEQSKIRIETNIEEAYECLHQIGTYIEYIEAAIAREEDEFASAINSTDMSAANAKQIARLVIAKKLSNPNDVSAAIKSGKAVNSSAKSSELSNDAILDHVEKYTASSMLSLPNKSDDEMIFS